MNKFIASLVIISAMASTPVQAKTVAVDATVLATVEGNIVIRGTGADQVLTQECNMTFGDNQRIVVLKDGGSRVIVDAKTYFSTRSKVSTTDMALVLLSSASKVCKIS